MADSLLQKATSALGEAKQTVIASAENAKTDVVKDAVDNVVSRGIDGAKTLLHGLEEKKGEVSSKILGAVTHFTGSADSAATTANRDLPVSTDDQPLLAAGDREVETPWWKNCCGVLDLLKASSSSSAT
ncbi:unnamed protein product [Arabidopsis lyrata]|uniref:Predicted protein n=1 Tax=Arabidopsis lyrata subsp. lyrata TaxID=81972 RepID=D7KG45_ARALL|nr:uncharacterized protein LOC9328409 [Arabidopsis lyrata subsp. lyrata]EFH68606.1 predicted protein [Arabidopsis lyrata subsp. lyrata]CAH8251375.1 unnamed protein product [Arabidopsis lyrata]|eukprot:XP_002892347.1 uncharacterized protein LOC9328409 [Arabidopsis lyrata subsp. lyrata]